MTELTAGLDLSTGNRRIAGAVYRHRALTPSGLSERLFAWLFSGLVYPQIWEDPETDMEAMDLREGHRIVTIASGGCNMLAYLTRSPASVDAVDLNVAHVALNRLKLEALRSLPTQRDFFRFFGEAGNRHNSRAYGRFIAPGLDRAARQYWEGRDALGRRRITVFDRDFYRSGLLGNFIAMGHLVARLHGVDPVRIMDAATVREQRRFFEEQLSPLFDRALVRRATALKASLFGLGIPPAQYDALREQGERSMADVLRARLERLACHFSLKDNYFAWQAFARRYPAPGQAALPAYLEPENFAVLRSNAGRVAVHHANFAEHLAGLPAASVDRFVLLDAQDWMTDRQLDEHWAAICRTAAPGARVIFRTAAAPSLLEGRVADHLLGQWHYHAERSRRLSSLDRSAIYGGFHLYEKR